MRRAEQDAFIEFERSLEEVSRVRQQLFNKKFRNVIEFCSKYGPELIWIWSQKEELMRQMGHGAQPEENTADSKVAEDNGADTDAGARREKTTNIYIVVGDDSPGGADAKEGIDSSDGADKQQQAGWLPKFTTKGCITVVCTVADFVIVHGSVFN